MRTTKLLKIAKDLFLNCITILTGCGAGIFVGILALIIVVGLITFFFGLIVLGLSLEYIILALLSRGACYLLGITWMGWLKTFFVYLFLIIVRDIYYELTPEN